ncbi:MAG: aldo/keto reductase, partial [Roseburia sp.]|nr:aldo/keto reductase [Roseburia sp.]
MEKRKLKKLGIETSLLGFGCMRFPVNGKGEIDEPLAEKMLDKAIAEGVNYIDTAYPYHGGASEPFVGRVLKKYPRDSFYLATKLPVWMVNTLEDVERIFQEQLYRLQTDYIDFYLLHAMGRERWEKMLELGCVKRLEELQAEGKIRYLGFSFHDEYEVFDEMIRYRDWDFCQIQLNYM